MTAAKLRNENQKTVIKTDDLNVDQPKETNREYAVPGQIKRDTAAVAGGKQVEYKLSKKMLRKRSKKGSKGQIKSERLYEIINFPKKIRANFWKIDDFINSF